MTLPPLDSRVPVFLDRLRSAPTDAQAGIRRHAEVIARACGRTLQEAIAELTLMSPQEAILMGNWWTPDYPDVALSIQSRARQQLTAEYASWAITSIHSEMFT